MIQTSRTIPECIKYLFRNGKPPKLKRASVYHYSTNSNENDSRGSLYRQLHSKMLSSGPISIAEYMKEVLRNPLAGYYMNKDVLGEKGDFVTSPEISQLFGEMIAVWILNEYNKITDTPLQLVELGPGRGTMMKDILRVFTKLKFSKKISVHLVEMSPTLSKIQAKKLCDTFEDLDPVSLNSPSIGHYRKGITKEDVNVYWYYSINDIPRNFSVFLAHEFFDALPIHKFQKTDGGWREVLVDIAENVTEEKFRYVLSRTPTPASITYLSRNENRIHVEVSPETMVITNYISQFLWECGGFALIIDYGHDGEKTDTFRAFSEHKQDDPLRNPGTMDLTADVDFSVIKRIAEEEGKLITFGPITQQTFLRNLGIDARLGRLLLHASSNERHQLESGYKMIMEEMGTAFKVMSLFPSVLKEHLNKWPVAGFQILDKEFK